MRTPILVLSALALAGCASSGPRVVAQASPDQQHLLLDQVKSLQGTWESTDEKGAKHVSSVFAVTSNGSAVREIMLPGTQHEMTNVYHMDGPTLVMTHYCALGNQPRLRAEAPSAPGTIALKFDSATNFTHPGGMYMGEMTLTIQDKDHLTETWTDFKNGKRGEPTTFTMVRKSDRAG